MGAIFRVKIIECEKLSETLKQVKAHKYQVLATSLKTKNSIYDIDYNKKSNSNRKRSKWSIRRNTKISRHKSKNPDVRKNRKSKCLCSNRNNAL